MPIIFRRGRELNPCVGETGVIPASPITNKHEEGAE